VLSNRGKDLIKQYEHMSAHGYATSTDSATSHKYNNFELQYFKEELKPLLKNINSILDYGCGESNWSLSNFDTESGMSAQQYFSVPRVFYYEPAKNLDERVKVDTVISFDVLEHIFLYDVPAVLRDIYSYANKSVILNIAGYSARALLPNGENAHTTVRPLDWWKGMLDSICIDYPHVTTHFIYSVGHRNVIKNAPWSSSDWLISEKFVVEYK